MYIRIEAKLLSDLLRNRSVLHLFSPVFDVLIENNKFFQPKKGYMLFPRSGFHSISSETAVKSLAASKDSSMESSKTQLFPRGRGLEDSRPNRHDWLSTCFLKRRFGVQKRPTTTRSRSEPCPRAHPRLVIVNISMRQSLGLHIDRRLRST